jgi:hypothetical protein
MMRPARTMLVSLCATTAICLSAATAHADRPGSTPALDTLYQQVLNRPADPDLNIRFAQLAEEAGQLRWALAAYERVLLNDPNNAEAQRGLQRIRRALQPNVTLVTATIGTAYESNPTYYLPGKGEMQLLGSLDLRDERNINGTRWRTSALAAGQLHARENDLNYGVAGVDTGPVLDLTPVLSVHPSIGGSIATFDNHYYYSEAAVGALFEGNLEGAYRALQLRLAYRSHGDHFPSGEGFYADARGRLTFPKVFGDGSVFIVSPWLRWSDINGTALTNILTEVQPGAYWEYGGKIEAYKTVAPWLVVGGNLAATHRDYRKDLVNLGSSTKREDTTWSPGATILFPNRFAALTDLRLDYRYISNHSNDPTKEFDDHIVSATVVTRFDPGLWGLANWK